MRHLSGGLMLVLLCSGCAGPIPRQTSQDISPGEKYSRTLETPEAKAAAPGTGVPVPLTDSAPSYLTEGPWWAQYKDPELEGLIRQALAGNPGINQSRKRLEQAAAVARISFADLLPEATGSLGRSKSRGTTEAPSTFSLRGAADYELDLWGGNRATYRANSLSAKAAAQDVETSAITLVSSVVEDWLTLLSLREEEALLQEQTETNQMVLDLQHKRYSSGSARALDVLQQTEVLARSKAQLPDIQSQQEVTAHSLMVLAGESPTRALPVTRKVLPEVLPLPQAGLPADLLQNRPDIQAAWLRVLSADWASESARVDRLPNLNISLDYSTASTKFKNLFDVWALDLAANLVAPLFDGGRRKAEHLRQKALADERFQAYRDTVLSAIQEVEDALSQTYHQAEKIKAIEEQLNVSRSALEQATIGYGNGDTDYISVLNSLINVQSLEQQLVRARRDLALYRVDLYRALGLSPYAMKKDEGASG